MAGRGKFREGRARDRAVASSGVPVASSACGVMTSIGELDSATVRFDVRVPVTTMVCQMLAEVSEMGGDAWDWCSLMERQRHSH